MSVLLVICRPARRFQTLQFLGQAQCLFHVARALRLFDARLQICRARSLSVACAAGLRRRAITVLRCETSIVFAVKHARRQQRSDRPLPARVDLVEADRGRLTSSSAKIASKMRPRWQSSSDGLESSCSSRESAASARFRVRREQYVQQHPSRRAASARLGRCDRASRCRSATAF